MQQGRTAPRKLVCLETYCSDRQVQAFRERLVLADFAPARRLGHILHLRGAGP